MKKFKMAWIAAAPAAGDNADEPEPQHDSQDAPTRFARAATEEDFKEFFLRIQPGGASYKLLNFIVNSAASPFADAAVIIALPSAGASWARAQFAIRRGKYKEARSHFERCLRKSNNAFLQRCACAVLAFMAGRRPRDGRPVR